LLIKPVQRICKYPLLFGELLRQLHNAAQSGMQSYVEDLTKAAEAVEQIAQSVNAQVGESESMERIVEAYEELGGEKGAPGLVEAHRRFVRTDDVLVHEPASDKDGDYKDRLIYLFNDVMIIAKSTHATGGTLHKLSAASLVERPKSLLKAINKSVSGTLHHVSSRVKIAKREQIAKVEHWLDIGTMSVTPLESKQTTADKKFGIAAKHIGRKTEEISKRSTLTRHKSTTSSGKIITVVEKFEFWFYTKEERDSFFDDINRQIERQTSLASGQKKAESEVGTPKTQRSWTRKSRHDSNLSFHGRTNSGSVLTEIEGKYKS